jgi:hypothetical protein
LQKVHVENSSRKYRQKFDVSFSSTFCFVAFSGVSQQWSVQKHDKKVLLKNRVNEFYQEIGKKSKTDVSRFCLPRFWALGISRRGEFKKTTKSRYATPRPSLPAGRSSQSAARSQSLYCVLDFSLYCVLRFWAITYPQSYKAQFSV